ncbi:MAG: hypothetical protein K9G64_06715 [Bacteroidia bacterium]|nr:hypothetical protein [Bacteroidia bacterium]
MKLPVIKHLVEIYSIEELQLAEQNMLDEKPLSIDVEGSDEGEQLTHILGAIDVLERVKLENKDKSTALREFFQRVRNSIS